jgi:hypothetical protein
MKREKVSPDEWRERLNRAVNSKRGRWRTLPRAIASSRAFAELSKSGLIVVLAMLDNLAYKGKSKKGRNALECCGLPLDNDGEFVITNNELIARGLKSPDSITRGRREAWKLGFYDVVKTGSLMNYGIYRYSERWKNFPDGDYLPRDERVPGKCLYPREKKAQAKPTTENVVSNTTENVVKEGGSVTTENVVIKTGSPTTDSVVNIIMYHEDNAAVRVQEKDQAEDPERELPQDTPRSKNSEDNQDLKQKASLTPSSDETDLADIISKESEATSLHHQWFIDAFSSACLEKGVEADLTLSPSLASSLHDWLDQRLSKRSYLGNKVFYDETIPRIKEKLSQIVTQWEFIKISYLGERVQIPDVPDMAFLVTYREQIFAWVSEQRQRSLNRIFAQFEPKQPSAPAHTH